MVDRIEQPDDAAFNLDRIRNRDLTLEQVLDRLGDNRLAVSRGP